MQYMLLIYNSDQEWAALPQERVETVMAQFRQYTGELAASGLLRAGSELTPSTTATTVRKQGGKLVLQDGPFAETKEQLGGYYLIEAADLDEALRWAERCPGAEIGCVEVRALQPDAE